MNIPGFTAEASLYENKSGDYLVRNTGLRSEQLVIPQLRRINVKRGLGGVFLEYYCARFGGGMASEADGSISCYFD